MNLVSIKLKEVIFSVLPVTLMVVIVHFTIVPLGSSFLIGFLIGSILIIIGLTLFLIGVDISITPLGDHIGTVLTKSNKMIYLIIGAIVLGFFISFAEPGLIILGQRIEYATMNIISSMTIVMVVSIGIAFLLALAFIRIIYGIPLYILLAILYFFILMISFFVKPQFLVIAFDTSGATTGVLAVPFILALAKGISHLKKDSKASEKDSFGTIAIVSTGAILSVLIYGLIRSNIVFNDQTNWIPISEIGRENVFVHALSLAFNESLFSMIPLIVIFIFFQLISPSKRKKFPLRLVKGFIYSFLGLFIFLTGVYGGFMDVGAFIGYEMGVYNSLTAVLMFGFILGVTTILAEPAVHVLTEQIEEVTSGYITKNSVLVALSLGVGIAVILSLIRVYVPFLQIWHYLLPGYILALGLSYFIPKIFVGIAFDAGGVATGPMTATFILAFMNGITGAIESADLIMDGFGMIAMVALMPVITLELLGLIYVIKSKKKGV
jgi:hypothetical protein